MSPACPVLHADADPSLSEVRNYLPCKQFVATAECARDLANLLLRLNAAVDQPLKWELRRARIEREQLLRPSDTAQRVAAH